MKCPKCGKEINKSARFCRHCGNKIEQKEHPNEIAKNIVDEGKRTEVKRAVDPMKIVIVSIVIVFLLMIVAAVAKNYQKENKNIIGTWVPASGFEAPSGLPDRMELYKEERAVIEGETGTYFLDEENGNLDINVSIVNVSYNYELGDETLCLTNYDGEATVYLNLDTASEEALNGYRFAQTIVDSNFEDYLNGRWNCIGKENGEESGDGYYFKYDKDEGISYNLPYPECNEESYTLRENKIMFGHNRVNAFRFIPISEDKMNIYCYEGGGYYNFEKES